MLSITLLDSDIDSSVSSAVSNAEKWSEFIDSFVPGSHDVDLSDEVRDHLKVKPLFLSRYAALCSYCLLESVYDKVALFMSYGHGRNGLECQHMCGLCYLLHVRASPLQECVRVGEAEQVFAEAQSF